MENQDVIELGSSDDETIPPVPKKRKTLSNAMVHIPNKLQGITIKHATFNTGGKLNTVLEKTPSVTRISNNNTTTANINKNKSNGRCIQKSTPKLMCRKLMNVKPQPITNKVTINPVNIIAHNPNIFKKTTSESKSMKQEIKLQPSKVIALPSSITIKRTRGCMPTINSSKINMAIVELDDDENSPSSVASGSPQWYLRPEEQFGRNNLEKENNAEPKTYNMIEITIEDSPVKPCLLKETLSLNKDPSILIEDSPVKCLEEVKTDESKNENVKCRSPKSKKQLSYPEKEQCELSKSVMETDTGNQTDNSKEETKIEDGIKNKSKEYKNQKDCQSIDQNAITNDNHVNASKHNLITNDKFMQGNKRSTEDSTDNEEFHPILQKYINLCFQIDNTTDMEKIMERRVKNYYRQVSKSYVESDEFLNMVSTKTSMTEADPSKMYLYLKDIVDELNLRRKMVKACTVENEKKYVEDKEEKSVNNKCDNKRQRQIRKLEKTMKKLNRAIKILQEQEVDFDDEGDSVYLLTERYKERFTRVHAKFCQLSNTKMPSNPRIQIQPRPGKPPGPARKLEKLINKKVPFSTLPPFPDFHDVLKCVREANEEDRLGWDEDDIKEEAQNLFISCGKKLQRRRQEYEWRLGYASEIAHSVDPAENNESLQKKLNENKIMADTNMVELLNRYADKQRQLRLEATEIGDKEADESPIESEDEEINDNSNSLDSRQKRKDRLRRLLEEKSKKSLIKKAEHSSSESKQDTLVDSLSCKNKDDARMNVGLVEVRKVNEIEFGRDKNDISKITNSGHLETIINKNDINMELQNKDKDQTEDSKGQTYVEIPDDISEEEDKVTAIDEEHTDSANDSKFVHGDNKTAGKTDSKNNDDDSICLISDDSDGDELNLLQKLHSESEMSSDSSDNEAKIVDSDTFNSNSEFEEDGNYNVISLEDSSSSEFESRKDYISKDNIQVKNTTLNKESVVYNSVHNVVDEEIKDTDNEKILLASSEDEDNLNENDTKYDDESECINLKDDVLSISETCIGVIDNDGCTNNAVKLSAAYDEKDANEDDIISISDTCNNKLESRNKNLDSDERFNTKEIKTSFKGKDLNDVSDKERNTTDENGLQNGKNICDVISHSQEDIETQCEIKHVNNSMHSDETRQESKEQRVDNALNKLNSDECLFNTINSEDTNQNDHQDVTINTNILSSNDRSVEMMLEEMFNSTND
ncbi:myb-like protein X [Battus philenor]|uniref:myb-like protein X n=1 Tax=Battus philenor TaxID=42288 RepID=UPI0035D12FA5